MLLAESSQDIPLTKEDDTATFPKRQSKKSKRDSCDELLAPATKVLKEPAPDDLDIFGQYVAVELRHIKSDELRRKTKREITLAILKAHDKDEQLNSMQASPANWITRTDTTPSLSRLEESVNSSQLNTNIGVPVSSHFSGYCYDESNRNQVFTSLMPFFKQL